MKCPVCDIEKPSLLCPNCGFDSSRDYGKYPTFGPIASVPSASALREQRQKKRNPAKPEKRTANPVVPPRSVPPIHPKHPSTDSIHTTVSHSTAGPVPKSKWAAFFLCFFFGMFGCHKFYEGKKGMGLLYLCTMGLFGYGWLFDCIMLLCKPNPYFPNVSQSRHES